MKIYCNLWRTYKEGRAGINMRGPVGCTKRKENKFCACEGGTFRRVKTPTSRVESLLLWEIGQNAVRLSGLY